jgi:lysozyme family protein
MARGARLSSSDPEHSADFVGAMADINIALAATFGEEGLYSNDAQDPGGETWKGIARNMWPKWEGWKLVDAARQNPDFPKCLKDAEGLQPLVESFYRENFWPVGYDQIESQAVANEVFDFGVNQNLKKSVQLTQLSLKTMVVGPLVVDGNFGDKTLGALNAVDPSRFLNEFRARESTEYATDGVNRFIREGRRRSVVVGSDSDIASLEAYALKYMLGWQRRVMA